MVRFKINGQQYKASTTWKEVDPDKLAACNTFKDELKCLTNISHDTIDAVDDMQLFPVYTLISFIDDLDEIPILQALDVEDGRYDNFELAKQHLAIGKPYKKLLLVARVYYPEEKDTLKLLGLGASIVQQMLTFLSHYEDMINHKPTEIEKQAGVDHLNAFGTFASAYSLAGKDILKLEQVYALPVLTVYTALDFSFKEHRYQTELYRLKYPKKK